MFGRLKAKLSASYSPIPRVDDVHEEGLAPCELVIAVTQIANDDVDRRADRPRDRYRPQQPALSKRPVGDDIG